MKKLPKLLVFSLALFLTSATLPAQEWIYCEGHCGGVYIGSTWCPAETFCTVDCYGPGWGFLGCAP